MYMTIQQILREKNLSRYQLSKKSGVPWATLADICSGKTTLSRCSAGTLMKLSSTLDIPMEQLITLTVEKPQMHGGKPTDRLTPISGATPLPRSRLIIFAQNIYEGGENL